MKRFNLWLLFLALGIAAFIIFNQADAQPICPYCAANGEKSIVYDNGGTSTLMAWTPYYDEDGVYHSDDPNIYTNNYSCSNGHVWSEKYQYGELVKIQNNKSDCEKISYPLAVKSVTETVSLYWPAEDIERDSLAIDVSPATITAPAECDKLRQENEYLKRENCLLWELIRVYHRLVNLLEGKS